MSWELWVTKINPDTGNNFTEDEARLHVKSFRKNSKYYWMKRGYDESDAIDMVKSHQMNASKLSVLANEGKDDVRQTQFRYWMNRGYSETDAKLKVSEIQSTFSLEICIDKHGEDAGKKIWQDRQNKWLDSLHQNDMDVVNGKKALSLPNDINKYGIELGICKFKDRCKVRNMNMTTVYQTIKKIGDDYDSFSSVYKYLMYVKADKKGMASTESLSYFIPLYKSLRKLGFQRNDIMFGLRGSKELCLMKSKKQRYLYDFTVLSKKIIVEYNNKCWHPDPSVMDADEWLSWKHPHCDQTASDKFAYDYKKEQLANKHGYKVLKIWNHLPHDEQMNAILSQI